MAQIGDPYGYVQNNLSDIKYDTYSDFPSITLTPSAFPDIAPATGGQPMDQFLSPYNFLTSRTMANGAAGLPATPINELPLVGAGSTPNPATSLSTPSGNGLGGGLGTPGPAGGGNTPVSGGNTPGPGGSIPGYQPPGGANTPAWGQNPWGNGGGLWGNPSAWEGYRAGYGRGNTGFGPQPGRQPAPRRPQSQPWNTNVNWLYYSNALRSPGRRAVRAT